MKQYIDRRLSKPLSSMAMGCAFLQTDEMMAPVLDLYLEAGGLIFDTAPRYGAGLVDRLLGQWMRSRGVRDTITLVGKGAFSPCEPNEIAPGLDKSLNDLQTEYLDIYLLHRDNTAVPAAEFVDALNQEVAKGRIRAFGGSNWSPARIGEANEYAKANALQPFDALSNQFSLASMIQPAWPGTLSLSETSDIAWLKQNDLLFFGWSSLARGFFTDYLEQDRAVDPDFAASWHSAENFARRNRARMLASQLGTTLPRIALAYVLCQDFRAIPVIGPLTTDELRDSLGALHLGLRPDQVTWLRDGDGPPPSS